MGNNQDGFAQFMRQREEAALAYVNGDPEPLSQLAANAAPATFFSPRGDVTQGAGAVRERYISDASAFATNNENTIQVLHMGSGDDIAYWVGIQRSDVHLQGKDDVVPFHLRVTEIFRRDGQEWKLVHRHADPLMAEVDT